MFNNLENKTIVIDARMINMSGIGKYVQAVVAGIVNAGCKLILLGRNAELYKFYWYKNVKVIEFDVPIYGLKEQLKYPKVIPVCDIFFSPHYNVPVLKVKAISRLVTIHDVYHLAFSSQLSLFKKLYANLVMKVAVKRSKKIITVSNFTKAEIIKYTGCPSHKVQVIYNGVSKTTNSTSHQENVSVKYKIGSKKYLLFVGNVKPHKNLISLVRAFKILPDTITENYNIVVAGKKDGMITEDRGLHEMLQADQSLVGKVIFTGFVEDADIDALYAGASLFVFPSVYEGFGIPPVEAMLNNCPVIASSSSSIPEICGNAVLYFDPLAVTEIAECIEEVLTKKEVGNDLVENGKQRAQLFKWANSVEQHKSLLNSLANTLHND